MSERIKDPVVLLSGGLDSSTLLYYVVRTLGQKRTLGLAVAYGQRHSRELESAHAVAEEAGIALIRCNLGAALEPIFAGAPSSQVGALEVVPEGHYAAESMKSTIVPNRNGLLLNVAAALAVSQNRAFVAYAAHAGDHPIYPDCRPEFANAMGRALELGSGIRLYAPFALKSKTDIVRLGDSLGVPFALTYSCYNGRAKHCGRCGTCVERREAFQEAGVYDPTPYED